MGLKKRFSDSKNDSVIQIWRQKTAQGFNIRLFGSWVQIHLEQAEMPAPRRSLHSSRG